MCYNSKSAVSDINENFQLAKSLSPSAALTLNFEEFICMGNFLLFQLFFFFLILLLNPSFLVNAKYKEERLHLLQLKKIKIIEV